MTSGFSGTKRGTVALSLQATLCVYVGNVKGGKGHSNRIREETEVCGEGCVID